MWGSGQCFGFDQCSQSTSGPVTAQMGDLSADR